MTLGRWLILIGVVFAAAGLLVMLATKFGMPRLGRLPGDIVYRGKNTTVHIPIATCAVLSVLLTIVFSLFNRFR